MERRRGKRIRLNAPVILYKDALPAATAATVDVSSEGLQLRGVSGVFGVNTPLEVELNLSTAKRERMRALVRHEARNRLGLLVRDVAGAGILQMLAEAAAAAYRSAGQPQPSPARRDETAGRAALQDTRVKPSG
ncbi:MAG: PilZ domain-containing protein [Gammaproteobacteria bacterium]|nr:PilZ domain-containing protein [Gammaproteobacteria bacterium]